jgi:hypothetical protein
VFDPYYLKWPEMIRPGRKNSPHCSTTWMRKVPPNSLSFLIGQAQRSERVSLEIHLRALEEPGIAEPTDAVDRAGIPAFRSMKVLPPARQLIRVVRRRKGALWA